MIAKALDSTIEAACPQCGAPIVMPGYADIGVCTFCGSTLARTRSLLPPSDTVVASDGLTVATGPTVTPASSTQSAGEEQILHSVKCPQCAGPLSAREARRILACRHCGVRVAVKERGGVTRWYFPARVDRLAAAMAGATWLEQHPGIDRRARHARLVDARLVYAPIWEHKALLAGWEFGQKYRTQAELVGPTLSMLAGSGLEGEGERLELRLVKEGVKEPRLQERRFYQAATDFGRLGATRPRVTGRELLLPLLAGEIDAAAEVLEAEGDGSQVAQRGRHAALQPLSGAVSPDSHLFTFRETTSLLYYPLWLVRYQAGARPCGVVVDGRDGTVNSGRAPADNRRRFMRLGAQIAGALVVIALLVWLAVARGEGRASVAAAAVIVSVAAALLVARFRVVGEVEYHEPFSG